MKHPGSSFVPDALSVYRRQTKTAQFFGFFFGLFKIQCLVSKSNKMRSQKSQMFVIKPKILVALEKFKILLGFGYQSEHCATTCIK